MLINTGRKCSIKRKPFGVYMNKLSFTTLQEVITIPKNNKYVPRRSN